jgi:hypothetical protein
LHQTRVEVLPVIEQSALQRLIGAGANLLGQNWLDGTTTS